MWLQDLRLGRIAADLNSDLISAALGRLCGLTSLELDFGFRRRSRRRFPEGVCALYRLRRLSLTCAYLPRSEVLAFDGGLPASLSRLAALEELVLGTAAGQGVQDRRDFCLVSESWVTSRAWS